MVFYATFNSISVISRRPPLLTVFQSYHGDSSHYSCLSWVSPVLGSALKCLAQGHSHKKTQRIQCGSNQGPLDCKSNTLPLSHVGPYKQKKVTSIFCFSHYAFTDLYRFHSLRMLSITSKFMSFVNPFTNNPWFSCLLKTLWEKEKLLVISNFIFSHSVFYPSEELSAIFIKYEFVFYKLFQYGSLKFVVLERVNKFTIRFNFRLLLLIW